jgi:hypothetical protein
MLRRSGAAVIDFEQKPGLAAGFLRFAMIRLAALRRRRAPE